MSMEMHVFFRGKLPTKTALTRAMKELGFPFSIKPATGSLDQQHGYMPMLLRREETGVEFDVYDDPAALAEFADEGIDPSLDRMASFRWAGDMQEMLAGMCCAAALAKLVNGVVFDAEEGKRRSVDEAIAFARGHLQAVDKPEHARPLGTRPADIKRYLKPLLKLRPDLALVGRHLLTRPVRHLLRGAFLDRTGDRYSFSVYRFARPLYEPAGYVRQADEIHRGRWKVYEPYFEPLLLDSLAEDVFSDLGQITAVPEVQGIEQFTALALWGRLEEATDLVNECERKHPDDAFWRKWVEKQRWVLAHGIPDLCEENHKKELETAKAMKLGDIWEASPFPAELSGRDRESRVSEPLFVTTPWVSRRADLYQELPQHSGEIRFAKQWLYYKCQVRLLTPLTSEQAQEERRKYQHYILAARLRRGQLLCLCHDGGRNSRDPDQPASVAESPPVATSFRLWVFGSTRVIYVGYTARDRDPGLIRLRSLEACEKETLARTWTWSADLDKGTKRIWRGGVPTDGILTPEMISLCQFPMPPILEYEEFWRRARTLLESEGFGKFI